MKLLPVLVLRIWRTWRAWGDCDRFESKKPFTVFRTSQKPICAGMTVSSIWLSVTFQMSLQPYLPVAAEHPQVMGELFFAFLSKPASDADRMFDLAMRVNYCSADGQSMRLAFFMRWALTAAA